MTTPTRTATARTAPNTNGPIAEAIRRDRSNRRADLVTYGLVMATLTATGGWGLMLAIGVIHHDWIPACPTLGFGHSMLLAMLLRSALLLPTMPRKEGGR